MAFRVKEAALCLMLAVGAYAADVTIEVRHDHLRRYGAGSLSATDTGLVFKETGKKAEHGWTLEWKDIQQFWISPTKVLVLSYADTWWKLGADREYELEAALGSTFVPIYSALKTHLDQRLVAALPDAGGEPMWRLPVKLKERFGGPEGLLIVTSDRIVFDSPEKGKSRTWRTDDIDNVSSSGPFDLTVTTFERSKGDYGSRRAFNFQLKERLAESRYNALWRKLNESKQLGYISSIQENQK